MRRRVLVRRGCRWRDLRHRQRAARTSPGRATSRTASRSGPRRTPTAAREPNSTPVVAAGKVYVLSKEGVLACLDAKTGNPAWRESYTRDFGGKMMSGWGYSETPLIDGDKLICTPGRMTPRSLLFTRTPARRSGDRRSRTRAGRDTPRRSRPRSAACRCTSRCSATPAEWSRCTPIPASSSGSTRDQQRHREHPDRGGPRRVGLVFDRLRRWRLRASEDEGRRQGRRQRHRGEAVPQRRTAEPPRRDGPGG